MGDFGVTYRANGQLACPLAAGETISGGMIVCFNGSGYAVKAAPTSGYRFAGVALENADNSVGGDGDEIVSCLRHGIIKLRMPTATTQGAIGSVVYVLTPSLVTLTAAAPVIVIGKFVELADVNDLSWIWVDTTYGLVMPSGLYNDPHWYGNKAAWYDAANDTLRVKTDAAPSSATDGRLLMEAT